MSCSLAAVLFLISLAVRFWICNLVSFKGGIQQHAEIHTQSIKQEGMGGRRNEVRQKAFFEPIRGKTPYIGRQKNYPCDKNMKKTNVIEYDTIRVQI